MKLIAFVVAIMLLISSCGDNSLKGKIEERNGTIYLVNVSKEKAYQFTVKKTESLKDSVTDYETNMYKLAPGEERVIGKIKVITQKNIFDYEGAKNAGYSDTEVKAFIRANFPLHFGGDTAVDESGMPVVIEEIVNSFEIKGQMEITGTYRFTSKQ